MGVIDDIKQRLDIMDIVSQYVPLQKSGRNFKALCPFHTEKTPSFFVFPERQSWHCFGACATGGDAFSFVMKKEGVDFGEALRLLAEKTGVPLTPRKQGEKEEKEKEALYLANEVAAQYYHRLLLHSPAAQVARDHLQRRGVTEQSIRDFQLGFSLDNWQALRDELVQLGLEERKLIEAGVVVEKEEGGTYDRFRHRLMVPIREEKGRVIGFGARALDDSLPKYLNSPQTAIFDKSGVLYGIERAKPAIRKENRAVIVEGYMDVIMAHQYGFATVVSSLGTALTEKHVGILKKITRNLILALDADVAGEVATLRGVAVAARNLAQKIVPVPSSQGVVRYESSVDAEIRVVPLPPGKDPDEVIREDPSTWQRRVEEALPVIDYAFQVVTAKLDLSQVKDRSAAMEQLLPVIQEVKEPVRRSHYIQKLSRLTGVEERTLSSTLAALSPDKERRRVFRGKAGISTLLPSRDPLEEYCLALLFRHPELREQGKSLAAEYFERSENRALFLAWRDMADKGAVSVAELEEPLGEHLEEISGRFSPSEEKVEKAGVDCARRLRQRWLRQAKVKEEILLAEAESKGDRAEVERLQEEGIKLNIQLEEIFQQRKRKAQDREGVREA